MDVLELSTCTFRPQYDKATFLIRKFLYIIIIIIAFIHHGLGIVIVLALAAALTHVLSSAGAPPRRAVRFTLAMNQPTQGWPLDLGGPLVTGLSMPSECLKYQFCRGSSCGSCRAIAACSHTLVWTWTLKMCCFRAPSVGGSMSLSMFAEEMPSQLRDCLYVDPLGWVSCTYKGFQGWQHSFCNIRFIQKHLQSFDNIFTCFEVDLLPVCLAYAGEPSWVVSPSECMEGWQSLCSFFT